MDKKAWQKFVNMLQKNRAAPSVELKKWLSMDPNKVQALTSADNKRIDRAAGRNKSRNDMSDKPIKGFQEEHGAGELGTNELASKYRKDTPGQEEISVKSAKIVLKKKRVDEEFDQVRENTSDDDDDATFARKRRAHVRNSARRTKAAMNDYGANPSRKNAKRADAANLGHDMVKRTWKDSAAKRRAAAKNEEFEITESDKAEYDKLMKQYGDMPASKIPPKTYMRISQLGRKVRGDKGGPKVGDLLKSMKKRKMGEDVEQVDEAKMGKIRKEVAKGTGPWTTVAIVDRKVVEQENSTLADHVPAVVKELKRRHPTAKISVEDKGGSVMYSESFEAGISEEVDGWVAMYNGKRLEIPNDGKVKGIAGAKAKAIKDLKVPKSKIGMLAIKPGSGDVDEGRIGGGRRSFRGSGMKHIRVRDDEGYRKDGSNPVDDEIRRRNAARRDDARRKFAARKVPTNDDKNKDPKKNNEEVDEVDEGAIGRITRAIGNIKDKRITSKDDAARKEKRKINFKKRLKDANREAQWEREDGRKGDSPGTRIKDAQSYAASRSEPSDKAREAAKRIKARRIRQGAEDRRKANEEFDQVDEGGMIGRTKPSRELNVQKDEKPHLAGVNSLKFQKRAAHKAERKKGKKDVQINPDMDETVDRAKRGVDVAKSRVLAAKHRLARTKARDIGKKRQEMRTEDAPQQSNSPQVRKGVVRTTQGNFQQSTLRKKSKSAAEMSAKTQSKSSEAQKRVRRRMQLLKGRRPNRPARP